MSGPSGVDLFPVNASMTQGHMYQEFGGWFSDGIFAYGVDKNSPLAMRINLDTHVGEIKNFSRIDPSLSGFSAAFAFGGQVYLVPGTGQQTDVGRAVAAKIAHFDLANWDSVQMMDLGLPDVSGFSSGFLADSYGYALPDYSHTKIVRFSLGQSQVQSLDIAMTDPSIQGFSGGFSDGTHGYAIVSYSGKVARFSLMRFASIEVMDMSMYDSTLRGFGHGFSDGAYGYLCPGKESQYKAIVRFSLQDFSQFESLNLAQVSSALQSASFAGVFLASPSLAVLVPMFGAPVVTFNLVDFSYSSVHTMSLGGEGRQSNTGGGQLSFGGGFMAGDHGYLLPRSSHDGGGMLGRLHFSSTQGTATSTTTHKFDMDHTASGTTSRQPGTGSAADGCLTLTFGKLASLAQRGFRPPKLNACR